MNTTNVLSQSNLIIDLSKNESPILLEGIVNVTHGPDSNRKDSMYIEYNHYILINHSNDSINYLEIFESNRNDSLMVDSYNFVLRNDTIIFESRNDFYGFSGFGKTIFLSRPNSDSYNQINTTPKKFTDSLGMKIDTNYYYFHTINKDNIIDEFKNIRIEDIGNLQFIDINFFEKRLTDLSHVHTKTNHQEAIYSDYKSFWCILDDSRFYKEMTFLYIQKYDKSNLSFTKSIGVYKRQKDIPKKLQRFVK